MRQGSGGKVPAGPARGAGNDISPGDHALTLRILITAALLAAPAPLAFANEFEAPLRALAGAEIAAIVREPALIEAIRAQNAAHAGLAAAEIETLDQTWRAEVGAGSGPTIDPVLGNAASDYLRGVRDASGGLFTEIFAMDAVGLNVAASDITSDYWQGDEDKWSQTFGAGADAVHVGEVELDESTQTYQSQVSVTIVDPDTGAPIGAVTFGVDVGMVQ